jgi:hypothetical protein
LTDSIREGELVGVDLITRKHKGETFDQELDVTQEETRLKLKVPAKRWAKSQVAKLFEIGKRKGYEEIQLRLRDPQSNQISSPRFGTAIEDAADLTFAKHLELMGFSAPLDQCASTIVDELTEKLTGILYHDPHWRR